MKIKNKIIEIEWLDSKGITSSWEFVEELLPLKPSKCKSIGYVVQDKEQYITIVQSISKKQILGRLTIPKRSITKMREI